MKHTTVKGIEKYTASNYAGNDIYYNIDENDFHEILFVDIITPMVFCALTSETKCKKWEKSFDSTYVRSEEAMMAAINAPREIQLKPRSKEALNEDFVLKMLSVVSNKSEPWKK